MVGIGSRLGYDGCGVWNAGSDDHNDSSPRNDHNRSR
jgi:hypothetical protein